MRAIWKGAVAFGLVNVPVRVYAATGEHQVTLHQVHAADGGRIRYRKVCSACGEEVTSGDIAKGYPTDDGGMVILTDEDMDQLPLASGREIAVEEFVPAEQVDPIMLGRTYYLEPDTSAVKPYALLRGALAETDRVAVVKVALRQRESMAVLRVRDDVICMQLMLWPDEIRAADFPVLDTDVELRPQEQKMASSLVESLAADFDPSEFEDAYAAALAQLIESKQGEAVPVPTQGEEEGAEVVDLLSALQRSVERARSRRGEEADDADPKAGSTGPSGRGTAKKGSTTKKGAEAKKEAKGSAAKGAGSGKKRATGRRAS